MLDFPTKQYDIIYADPPWSFNDKMTNYAHSLTKHYETQSIEWIKSLPVNTIAKNDCVLLLWAVSSQLQEALDVISAWGFKFKTIAFVWNKKSKTGKQLYNLGRWTMPSVEIVLLGVKGTPNKWREDLSIKQLVESERGRHSEKPEEVRRRIEKLFGDKKRIELFARKKSDGWDVWGNDPSLKEKEAEDG